MIWKATGISDSIVDTRHVEVRVSPLCPVHLKTAY